MTNPPPPPPSASLTVAVEGLRDHKGNIIYCLTRRTAEYLACDRDPHAVHGRVPAATGAIAFEHVLPGEWALLLVHDRNANGKFDKRFGIPREGFGFSGNPAIRFGAPSAKEVAIAVPAGESRQTVRMRYIF
ncbi:MAG: DUF2141 domain-containing protein [Sphingomicrobium sp.]